MFKTLVLGALYNLSDDQVEYQVRDRLSFMRFLGLGLGDRVPDAKTVWLYREALAQAGKVDDLFKLFDHHLARQGYIARGGQILDASIVPVPRNHNTREENAAIKDGKEPAGWKDKPAKRCQKDIDAEPAEKPKDTRKHYAMYATRENPKHCVHCSSEESRVLKTVTRQGTNNVSRRRRCNDCGKPFMTIVWGGVQTEKQV